METLTFFVDINAPKEKVWDVLWSDAGYREWTAAFTPGSYAESDWQQGSKITFLSPQGNGMFAIIEKKIPNHEMSFVHQGEIINGVEEKKDWAGARESYFLKETDGVTTLRVELDATEDFQNYFKETFPKALALVKEIAER
jgi:uncharacterized protein YndB with AHSA1/START domain